MDPDFRQDDGNGRVLVVCGAASTLPATILERSPVAHAPGIDMDEAVAWVIADTAAAQRERGAA